MRAARLGLLLVSLATLLVACRQPMLARRRACLAPLGDSLTQGSSLQLSYRYWLWASLKERGARPNFVGSLRAFFGGSPVVPDAAFDLDHEGHWGWRADEFLRELPRWLRAYEPGIVLLLLGTNDCWQGQSAASTLADLAKIIDVLRARSPQVAILLATVLPTDDPKLNLCLNELNAMMPALVARSSREQSPILIVDLNEGFEVATETYDGVHPNEAGEKKLAQRWERALLPLLETAEPCP
jgi:acyl-CoA thioesterase-1